MVYKSPWNVETEIYHKGRYGAKGEKRAARRKATPAQIKRQNAINRSKKLRRTLQLNFTPGDYWLTLKYPRGTRKKCGEVKKEFAKFIRILKREYKRHNEELRYIYRIEIGTRGGIHVHMVINRTRIPELDLIIERAWKKARALTPTLEDGWEDGELYGFDGMVHFAHIQDGSSLQALAEYLTKGLPEFASEEDREEWAEWETWEEEEEGEEWPELTEEERRAFTRYGSSRNLIRPEPEVKEYTNRTVRKLLEGGPDAIEPTPGFYVDKDSWETGVNPFTGYSYIKYRELPLGPIAAGPPEQIRRRA